MRTGRQTLHEIDDATAEARSSLDRTIALADRLADERAALERRRLEAISVIAAQRIDLLAAGDAGEPRDRDIRRADRKAAELLQSHAEQTARLRERTRAAQGDLERLETERHTLEENVRQAIEAFEAAAAASQDRMMQDDGYKALLARVEEAEAVVDRAERKRALAKEDEEEKGAPYRNDALFSYLWKRRYGTKDYRGGLVAKMLDGWVAGLCGYRNAALNFKRLTEIPARLADHVAGLEEQAEAERAALRAMETVALERDGAAKLREASLAAQARLEDLDAKIAAAEAEHRASLDAQTEAAGNTDGAYQQALRILQDTLEDEDAADLRRLAAQTGSLDDDDAVAELIALEDEVDDLEDEKEDARELISKYRRSLDELEQVRRRFKEARYDAPWSEFPTGELIGSLLGQIIVGALTSDDLWDHLRRGQRTRRRRADFDFGGDDWTGGFRIPSGRSGRSRGGRMTRPSRVPRQRSGRGGGFRTGGGF